MPWQAIRTVVGPGFRWVTPINSMPSKSVIVIALPGTSTTLYQLVEKNARGLWVSNSPSEKQISARLDAALADQFAAICKAKGLKQGFVINELVRGWVSGQSPSPGETVVLRKLRATPERFSP